MKLKIVIEMQLTQKGADEVNRDRSQIDIFCNGVRDDMRREMGDSVTDGSVAVEVIE